MTSLVLGPPSHSITSSARASSEAGNFEAERLGGRQIDDQIELGRLLDRDVSRLRPTQNLVDEVGDAPELVREVWAIRHQTARLNVLPSALHRRQSRAHRQDVDAGPIGVHERVGTKIKCIRAVLERLEGGCDVLRSPDFGCSDLKAERAGRCLDLAYFQHRGGIAHISHDRQPAKTGYGLAQQFEFLASSIRILVRQTGDVAARSRQNATKPGPTGSDTAANTIGMTAVACFAARVGGVADVTMTSTLS
jgi:hypothetical protein